MKIAYITSGAAGMYCGSCMRDNTLVSALRAQGHDALLIPTYTPIRTDEEDVSENRVFFGGVNVYLQEKLGLFRYTPWFLDRLLDAPRLLRWLGRFAARTQASEVVDLTLSILRGEHGHQRKEFAKLVDWLNTEVQPDLIVLTNVLISGLVPVLKSALNRPVVATLQGDDIFLDDLPEASRREACELIRANCVSCDRFLATCSAYADYMSSYLGLPRERVDVVYPGINLAGYDPAGPRPPDRPFTIGYFARICPEKGLHILVDAFCRLKERVPQTPLRLHVAGWLGERNVSYLREQEAKLTKHGLKDAFAHIECPGHRDKQRFLRDLDVLSVPTVYRDPKGLYVLEAWASGLPVVQPRHGSFPELLEASGGGLLFEPLDADDLARQLQWLLEHPHDAAAMGLRGRAAAHDRFHAAAMARETTRVFESLLSRDP